jgi:hypothetical protein
LLMDTYGYAVSYIQDRKALKALSLLKAELQ